MHAPSAKRASTASASRHPTIRWDPPVLTIDAPPDRRRGGAPRRTRPGRRPIAVLPPRVPECVALGDPDGSPVLHYPVALDARTMCDLWEPLAATRVVVAGPLLGRTRALVLDVIATAPCTTSELARRAGVSVPSASEHATVLREADLIVTDRVGRAVIHTITPLGSRLLGADPDGSTARDGRTPWSAAERARTMRPAPVPTSWSRSVMTPPGHAYAPSSPASETGSGPRRHDVDRLAAHRPDLQAFLTTTVHPGRHLRPWGDLGADTTATDGAFASTRCERAGSRIGWALPRATS